MSDISFDHIHARLCDLREHSSVHGGAVGFGPTRCTICGTDDPCDVWTDAELWLASIHYQPTLHPYPLRDRYDYLLWLYQQVTSRQRPKWDLSIAPLDQDLTELLRIMAPAQDELVVARVAAQSSSVPARWSA